MQPNKNAKSPDLFLKKTPIGKNSFSVIVKDMCKSSNISGSGVLSFMTMHGLRATMTSLLIEAGHGDSSIVLRTGNSSVDTLKRYHNLHGAEGLK